MIHSRRILQDKGSVGWLTWPKSVERFKVAAAGKSPFLPWEERSQEMLAAVQEAAGSEDYWKKLTKYFAEENHANVATQDNISCAKSLCRPFTQSITQIRFKNLIEMH